MTNLVSDTQPTSQRGGIFHAVGAVLAFIALRVVLTLLIIFDFLCTVAISFAAIFSLNPLPIGYFWGAYLVIHAVIVVAVLEGKYKDRRPVALTCLLLLVGVLWFQATNMLSIAARNNPEYAWTSQLIKASSPPICGRWEIVTTHRTLAHEARDMSELSTLKVVADNDVWAIGHEAAVSHFIGHSAYGLVMHWNGTRWQQEQLSEPQGSIAFDLQAILARSPDDVTVIGQSAYYSTTNPAVYLWNGKQWTRRMDKALAQSELDIAKAAEQPPAPLPDLNPCRGAVNDVASVNSDDAWAVGYIETAEGKQSGLTLHWNGTQWNDVPLPAITRAVQLTKVAARPGKAVNDVWASGLIDNPDDPEGPATDTLLLHWDGAKWSRVFAPNVTMPGSRGFSDIGVSPNGDLWAIGWSEIHGESVQTTVHEAMFMRFVPGPCSK